MTWAVTVAAETDAIPIADVHMAAFGSNPLLLAQFPTPDVRTQLRHCIAKKVATDVRDPNIAVLVARDQEKIVSFAKWSLPVTAPETYVEAPWVWPDGTNFSILREWTEKIEEAQERVLGELPSYRELPDLLLHTKPIGFAETLFLRMNIVKLRTHRFDTGLTFIGTDPPYERRGAATSLMQWGLDRCRKSNLPAYLEGTLNAVTLYERLGFKTMCKVSIVLEGSVTYEEACCLFEPCIEISAIEESPEANI